MNSIIMKIGIFTFVYMAGIHTHAIWSQKNEAPDFNELSENLIRNIKEGRETGRIENALAGTTLETLENALATDPQKIAFWVNVYNGYIQLILSDRPELYEDRAEFFEMEQIPIAGRKISFAKIEHGILRRSQLEFALGYIENWFPDKYERTLRVDERDYRIHFALNCGAKSCPPVTVYEPEKLNAQLNEVTREYLERTSTYKSEENEVAVTSLFKWFRGDFRGSSGIQKILVEYDIIPAGAKVDFSYKDYDWTLHLNNFTTF